jgi:hypothetical protein
MVNVPAWIGINCIPIELVMGSAANADNARAPRKKWVVTLGVRRGAEFLNITFGRKASG